MKPKQEKAAERAWNRSQSEIPSLAKRYHHKRPGKTKILGADDRNAKWACLESTLLLPTAVGGWYGPCSDRSTARKHKKVYYALTRPSSHTTYGRCFQSRDAVGFPFPHRTGIRPRLCDLFGPSASAGKPACLGLVVRSTRETSWLSPPIFLSIPSFSCGWWEFSESRTSY